MRKASDAQKLVFAYPSLAFGIGTKRQSKDERIFKIYCFAVIPASVPESPYMN